MDCCASGLASLKRSDVEVIGASAWESTAASSAQASITRAIINELKALDGAPITTTQLISRLHCKASVRRRMSMPIHQAIQSDDHPPALIHRIEKTPSPQQPLVNKVPKYAHVTITVNVSTIITIVLGAQGQD